jgi:hypothetical protein
MTFIDLDVEKHDNGFLLREAPHDGFADARCAAGNENDFPGEIGIDGAHDFLPDTSKLMPLRTRTGKGHEHADVGFGYEYTP